MGEQDLPGIHVYAPAQTSECPSLCSQKITLLFLSFTGEAGAGQNTF